MIANDPGYSPIEQFQVLHSKSQFCMGMTEETTKVLMWWLDGKGDRTCKGVRQTQAQLRIEWRVRAGRYQLDLFDQGQSIEPLI